VSQKTIEGMAYLAAPYTHRSAEVMQERFLAINKVAAHLMRSGELVLSPISHGVPIAEAGGLPSEFDFWNRLCREQLKACDRLYVLMLDGWGESVGVAAERAVAEDMFLPLHFLEPGRYGV